MSFATDEWVWGFQMSYVTVTEGQFPEKESLPVVVREEIRGCELSSLAVWPLQVSPLTSEKASPHMLIL